jgi:endoglucanase
MNAPRKLLILFILELCPRADKLTRSLLPTERSHGHLSDRANLFIVTPTDHVRITAMSFAKALAFFLIAATGPAMAETAADRFAPKRGINFELWVEWRDVEDMVKDPGFLAVFPDWRRHVPEGAVAALAQNGFDFVRLPIDPAPLLRLGPGAAQDALIGQVVETAKMIQDSGLKVIVDLHTIPRQGETWGTESIVAGPARFNAYAALVGQIAARLHGMDPDRTALELFNEPTNDCGLVAEPEKQTWPDQLSQLHQTARAVAPDLPLVMTGGCWGSADGLVALDPNSLDDDNLIWTFHSYDPFFFTHQGAGWTGGPVVMFAGVPYPPSIINDAIAERLLAGAIGRATAAGKTEMTTEVLQEALQAYREVLDDAVSKDIAQVAEWANAHGLPSNRILVGEFGVIRDNWQGIPVPPDSRAEFLDAKISAIEAAGFGWAVFDWAGSLAIADPATYRIDAALCPALRLTGC